MAEEITSGIGALCVGFVVAYIVAFFIGRFTEFNPTNLAAVLGTIFGGIVIQFLVRFPTWTLAPYCGGLAATFILVAFNRLPLVPAKPQERKPQPKESSTIAEDQPTFTLLWVTKKLEFLTADGRQARLTRVQRMKANAYAGEFWIRQIGASGVLEDIRVDGKPAEIYHEAGTTSLRISFGGREMSPGQEREVTVEYLTVDS
jgi:hypothetical protein